MALPRFVVVKSNHNKKYLRYIKEDGEENAPAGFLKFSGEEAGSHYAKYEVEMAKSSGNKGLVHIRCCYNNKYWVSVQGTDKLENEVLIVAAADETEEDQSKSSCTLFEPVYVDPIDDGNDDNDDADNNDKDDLEEDSQVVQFRHVQLGRYTTLHNSSDALVLLGGSNSTTADDPNNIDPQDVCTVVNWESLVILPKHVVFKGDDGNYLTAQITDRYGDEDGDGPYLIFESNDINDPVLANEIFTNPDGTLQIKNDFFGRYWRLAKEEWIWADAFNPTPRDKNYKDTLYKAIKVYDKVIALINVGNNNYCKRYTLGIVGFAANVPNLSIFSHLRVEEPVKSRTIYNVNYRLAHARTYNYQTDVEIATGEAVNFTQETTSVCIKLVYKKNTICSWNDISRVCSMKLKTNIEAQGVPRIAPDNDGSMKIAISGGEFKGEVQWGETTTWETDVETVCMVAVPAVSVVKVRLLASKAACDVPFSYSRRDTRINGEVHVTNDLDDGFYSGINAFNFKYDTQEEKM